VGAEGLAIALGEEPWRFKEQQLDGEAEAAVHFCSMDCERLFSLRLDSVRANAASAGGR